MPEYSNTIITPADGVQLPAQNGGISGNFQLSALRSFILASKGQANGLAGLGSDGKLDPSQVPGSLDDVLVYATRSNFPAAGTSGKIYIAADTNRPYRWDADLATPAYVELSVDLSAYATKAEVEAADTDLKNALQATNARVENLEQEHGSYQEVTVKSPYTVPSGKAKNWAVNVLRGVTRAKNNLLANGNFASSNGWNASNATINSVSDNVLTFTASAQGGKIETSGSYKPVLASGHCYLFFVNVKLTTASTSAYMNNGYTHANCVSTTSWQTLASVTTWNTTSGDWPYPAIVDNRTGAWDAIQVKEGGICDLNVHFGTSDLSFLGATDSAKLATIQQNYPELLVPSAYGSSLVSTTYEGVKSEPVGNNLINEATFGYIPSIDRYGITKKLSAGTYTISGNVATQFATGFIVNGSTTDITAIYGEFSRTFTLTAEKEFAIWTSSPTATIDWVMLNVGASALPYEEYQTDTLSIPTPITLRSAGTVAEEFDLESGVVTRRIGLEEVAVERAFTANGQCYQSSSLIAGADTSSHWSDLAPIMSPKIPRASMADMYAGTVTNGISMNDGRIIIGKDTYANRATLLDGTTLHFALATPTTEQLDPIQNPYLPTESGGTISSILTDAVDDSMTLGYINL